MAMPQRDDEEARRVIISVPAEGADNANGRDKVKMRMGGGERACRVVSGGENVALRHKMKGTDKMSKQEIIKIFGDRKIRSVWDDEAEIWYFSIVDVVAVQTESTNPANYWKVLKNRLKKEGNETVTNCNRLKLRAADGKMRMTDVATAEQMFRVIQSIPSPKAEPFKIWMSKVAAERIDQMQDPELSIQQALADYRRLGYSEKWIARRLKSIDIRKDLTDEWKARGVEDEREYAKLTNTIYKAWSGMTAGEYKRFKGLRKQNLRDNMTNMELILSMLAEESTREISAATRPGNMIEHHKVAASGGGVARNARIEIEHKTGRKVIGSGGDVCQQSTPLPAPEHTPS